MEDIVAYIILIFLIIMIVVAVYMCFDGIQSQIENESYYIKEEAKRKIK